MPKIDKDSVSNIRSVAVELLQYEVLQLIEEAALKEAGITKTKAVTVEIDLTRSTDSTGYERKTEGLAVGARVKITVDNNYVGRKPMKM